MFFLKSDINNNKKTAGKLATEVRTGDAPKPTFSMKSIEKQKKTSGNHPLNRQTTKNIFPSLHDGPTNHRNTPRSTDMSV